MSLEEMAYEQLEKISHSKEDDQWLLLNEQGLFLSTDSQSANWHWQSVITQSVGILSFTIADINQDGLVDIVLARKEANLLLLNQGDASFERIELDQSFTVFLTNSITVVDLDLDGDLDLVAANAGNNVIYWQHNGSFAQPMLMLERDHSKKIVIEDMNADGLSDLLVLNQPSTLGDGVNKVHLQVKARLFAKQGVPLGEDEFVSVDALFLDADADGDRDLVIANADMPDEYFEFVEGGLLEVSEFMSESQIKSKRFKLLNDLSSWRLCLLDQSHHWYEYRFEQQAWQIDLMPADCSAF